MAVRLEKAIGSTAGFWLRFQLYYDLAQIRQQGGKFVPAAFVVQRNWPSKAKGVSASLHLRKIRPASHKTL